jgi:hypothetical protein
MLPPFLNSVCNARITNQPFARSIQAIQMPFLPDAECSGAPHLIFRPHVATKTE